MSVQMGRWALTRLEKLLLSQGIVKTMLKMTQDERTDIRYATNLCGI